MTSLLLGRLFTIASRTTTATCSSRTKIPRLVATVDAIKGSNCQPKLNAAPCRQTHQDIKIRQLHPREVSVLAGNQAMKAARLGNEELRLMYDSDPGGFFIATMDGGDVIGTVAAVRQNDELGFIGFHQMMDSEEGKGSKVLWDVAMEYLGDRNVGIEVDCSDVNKYTKLGFQEEWRNGCFMGTGTPLLPEVRSYKLLRLINDIGYGQVVDFDTEICGGLQRVQLLLGWLQTNQSVAAQAILEDNRIVGYGVIRPLRESTNHRIGPLLAQNIAIAQVLLVSLLSDIPKETVIIDSPLANSSFTRLLETDLKMEQVAETVRMYTRGNPGVDVRKTFGILSKDIG